MSALRVVGGFGCLGLWRHPLFAEKAYSTQPPRAGVALRVTDRRTLPRASSNTHACISGTLSPTTMLLLAIESPIDDIARSELCVSNLTHHFPVAG